MNIDWALFPLLETNVQARDWLFLQAKLGLARNTIVAYGRGLNDFLSFCRLTNVRLEAASRADVSEYVNDLVHRPRPDLARSGIMSHQAGLSNATIQQRLTAIRLFFDFLVEESIRLDNPVGRGRYTPGKSYGGHREKGLVPRYRKLPWIPTEEQWLTILQTVQQEIPRNRVMFAMSYDAGLRREELCALEVADIDPANRLIRIRAETTKNRKERIVPYSKATSQLFMAYLQSRSRFSRTRGKLFLSESPRNRTQAISVWTWSKVVKRIANRSGVTRLTTHTLRHLCLTDLARAGWDLHEIAQLAGHKSIETTLDYIHLGGRDLAQKLERASKSQHALRVALMEEMFR
jgi:integrase/recombinase XerD